MKLIKSVFIAEIPLKQKELPLFSSNIPKKVVEVAVVIIVIFTLPQYFCVTLKAAIKIVR